MSRGFCPDCGSPIILQLAHRPKLVAIHAASLDDPTRHKPSMDVFTASAQPWDVMNPEMEKYPWMPPVPDSLGQ